jgi:hypothetical protein
VVGGKMDHIRVAKKHFERKLGDERKVGGASFKWLKDATEWLTQADNEEMEAEGKKPNI